MSKISEDFESVAPARVTINRGRVAEGIVEAAREDLDKREADRIERLMDPPRLALIRRRVRERVIDQAIDSMLNAGVIVATHDGVEAAVDWEEVKEFLKTVLPIILQILALF